MNIPTAVTPTTIEQINIDIRQIGNVKAATRPDIIPDEALRPNTGVTTKTLHIVFGKIWKGEHVPTVWKH